MHADCVFFFKKNKEWSMGKFYSTKVPTFLKKVFQIGTASSDNLCHGVLLLLVLRQLPLRGYAVSPLEYARIPETAPSPLKDPPRGVAHSYRCSPPTALGSYGHAPRARDGDDGCRA